MVIGAILLATGCSPRSADQTVVRFWAMGREGEVVTELIPEFERTHPGIRISVQQLPWSAAHEKLLTAFAGDSTPDVCQLGNTWIPEFVALHALEPLDGRLAGSPTIDPHDYFPGIWDTNVVEGKLYGVPWYVDTRLLFYRRDLLAQAGFAAPPQSWNDWQQMLAAIKARAKSVLGTLWRVEDHAARVVMEGFYTGLKSGQLSKAQALREAQLAVMKNKDSAQPFFWAPFVLIGNWR